MLTKEEFLNKVKKKIDFKNYEKLRISILTKMIISFVVLLSIFCGCAVFDFIIIIKYSDIAFETGLFVFTICFIVYGFLVNIPSDYNSKFKNEINKKYKEKLYSLFKLKKLTSLYYIDNIKTSNLFSEFQNTNFDDVIGNDDFVAMEIELVHHEIIDGHLEEQKYKTSVFKGLILLFSSNKYIKARTLISTKYDASIKNHLLYKGIVKGFICYYLLPLLPILYFALPKIIDILSDTTPFKYFCFIWVGMFIFVPLIIGFVQIIKRLNKMINSYRLSNKYFEELHLEDISFDKRFKVYSENQIEGRYLVTTAFMDRLYNLQTAFGEDNIKCSFYDDKIMFAISTKKDLFELGDLYHTFGKDIEQFYDQIASIYDMIEYFKLNERTGL